MLFTSYAAGMGVIVGAAALSVAVTRTARVGRLRRIGAVASRLGGGLLLIAGAYVAYYGWYEIRIQHDPLTTDPVIDAAGAVQQWIADLMDNFGVWGIAAILASLLFTVASRLRRPRGAASAR